MSDHENCKVGNNDLTVNQKHYFVTVVIIGIVSHVWEWQKDVLMS